MIYRFNKAVLISHITFSVGWIGAITVFIVLAITGLTNADIQIARASCLAMELSAWYVIVPFCFASLLTGVILAIGTKWGLFKHYWIVIKLFSTIVATLLLLLHLQPINELANLAKESSFLNSQHSKELLNIITKAGASILFLLVITTISIYKPWGKIQLKSNINNQFINMQNNKNESKKSWSFYALIGLVGLILIFIISHLFGGGMHNH